MPPPDMVPPPHPNARKPKFNKPTAAAITEGTRKFLCCANLIKIINDRGDDSLKIYIHCLKKSPLRKYLVRW